MNMISLDGVMGINYGVRACIQPFEWRAYSALTSVCSCVQHCTRSPEGDLQKRQRKKGPSWSGPKMMYFSFETILSEDNDGSCCTVGWSCCLWAGLQETFWIRIHANLRKGTGWREQVRAFTSLQRIARWLSVPLHPRVKPLLFIIVTLFLVAYFVTSHPLSYLHSPPDILLFY